MIDKTLYWSGRAVVSSYAHLMLRVDVRWHAPLPAGPKIIALNHPTTTDPFLVATLTREQAHILISETLFKIPVFGAYLRRVGHIPVVVGSGYRAFEEARRLLEMGRTVVIFPEGALSPDVGGLQRLHTGVARLALSTGAPVIPVGIHLQRERVRHFSTTVDGQPETARWYVRGPYHVTVGVPLYFKGDVEDHAYVKAVTEHISDSIRHLSLQSEQRMMAPVAPGLDLQPVMSRMSQWGSAVRNDVQWRTISVQVGANVGQWAARSGQHLRAQVSTFSVPQMGMWRRWAGSGV